MRNLLNQAYPAPPISGDAKAIYAITHPRGTWLDRVRGWLWSWRVRLFGFRGTEMVEIEIRDE